MAHRQAGYLPSPSNSSGPWRVARLRCDGYRHDADSVDGLGVQQQPGLGEPIGLLARREAVARVAEQHAADAVVLGAVVEDAVDLVRGHVAQVLGDHLRIQECSLMHEWTFCTYSFELLLKPDCRESA